MSQQITDLVPAVEYQPPVLAPKTTKTVVKLDEIAPLVKLYDQAVREYNEMGARIEALREEITARMGEANSGTVNNVEMFTYNLKNSYRTTDLRKDYPELTAQYMRPVTKDTFDMATFAKHHPAIAAPYQTREFRRTGGIQVLR